MDVITIEKLEDITVTNLLKFNTLMLALLSANMSCI